MSREKPQSRRTVLKLSGVALVPAVIAGCADEGPGEEEEDDVEDDDEVVDDEEEEEEEEDDENGEAIEPGEIELDGYTQGWEGVSPDEIEGEENPTLTLEEGESYEITWENADGSQHNIVIWDEDGDVVDDYETDLMDDEGETQTLEIDEVTDEMAEYVCEPHEGTMIGDIEVV